jgi:hypothetical protein
VAWLDFNKYPPSRSWIDNIINTEPVDMNAPPHISTPVRLSELSNFECRIPVLNWFITHCDGIEFKGYSVNLQRAFFSAPCFLNVKEPIMFEIVDKEVRVLPKEIAKSTVLEDIAVPNSILAKGSENEILLYDGQKLTPVPVDRNLYGDQVTWDIQRYTDARRWMTYFYFKNPTQYYSDNILVA